MEVYIGMIFMFAGSFAPRGFALCNGQLLNITQNAALFSILGTQFGGNGVQTFGLPDLRARVPKGVNADAPGRTQYVLGQAGGVEQVSLTIQNLPAHNHLLMGDNTANANTKEFPGANHVIGPSPTDKMYSGNPPNTNMNPASLSMVGNSQPIQIVEPYQAVTYIIATQGIFPSRN